MNEVFSKKSINDSQSAALYFQSPTDRPRKNRPKREGKPSSLHAQCCRKQTSSIVLHPPLQILGTCRVDFPSSRPLPALLASSDPPKALLSERPSPPMDPFQHLGKGRARGRSGNTGNMRMLLPLRPEVGVCPDGELSSKR